MTASPALKAMVEAMAAEVDRQHNAAWARDDGRLEAQSLDLEAVARAGLEAIRDPGDDVLDRGWAAFSPPLPQLGGQEAMWTAMLDAILKEQP